MPFTLQKVMVPVKGLPDVVRRILASVDFYRSDVAIEPAETFRFRGASGVGCQAFAVLFNLATGERHDFAGSWGGPSPNFDGGLVETDYSLHPIPPNHAVILGQRGGGRPVSATVIVRPDAVAPLLPPSADVTDRERRILTTVRSYTSAYRKSELAAMKVTDDEIGALVSRGLLTRNKAGAIGITTAGKNAVLRVMAP